MDKHKLILGLRRKLNSNPDLEDKESIKKVISAIDVIDRKFFVKDKKYAYADTALPIGHKQTISQPFTVATMLVSADIRKGDDVLEIGAGSGWNTCLAGFLSYPGKVLSADIISKLVSEAKNNLKNIKEASSNEVKKRLSNIEFECINILKNLDDFNKKFDSIIITAGIQPSQESLIEKLAAVTLEEKGTLVCPYSRGPLIIIKKVNGKLTKGFSSQEYAFVPLIS